MRRALALFAAALVLLSGCGDDNGVRQPAAGPQAPSRDELDRVGKAVALRDSDFGGAYVSKPAAAISVSQDRTNEDFARCLGLPESLTAAAVPSPLFDSAPKAPFVEWQEVLSRHLPADAARAVQVVGTAKGLTCLRPSITSLLRSSAEAQQDPTTFTGLTLVSLPVEPTSGATGARVTATFRSVAPRDKKVTTSTFAYDLVLTSRGGFVVTLSAFGFNELPSDAQRRTLIARLAQRLQTAVP